MRNLIKKTHRFKKKKFSSKFFSERFSESSIISSVFTKLVESIFQMADNKYTDIGKNKWHSVIWPHLLFMVKLPRITIFHIKNVNNYLACLQRMYALRNKHMQKHSSNIKELLTIWIGKSGAYPKMYLWSKDRLRMSLPKDVSLRKESM